MQQSVATASTILGIRILGGKSLLAELADRRLFWGWGGGGC